MPFNIPFNPKGMAVSNPKTRAVSSNITFYPNYPCYFAKTGLWYAADATSRIVASSSDLLNWTTLYTFAAGVFIVGMEASNNYLMVAARNGISNGIRLVSNDGITFTPNNDAINYYSSLAVDSLGNFYFAGTNIAVGGVYIVKTADGVSIQTSPIISASGSPRCLHITQNGFILCTSAVSQYYYGTAWNTLTAKNNMPGVAAGGLGIEGYYNWAHSGQTIVFSYGGNLLTSHDEGTTWAQNYKSSLGNVSSIAFITIPGIFICGSPYAAMCYSNSGDTWTLSYIPSLTSTATRKIVETPSSFFAANNASPYCVTGQDY